MRVRSGVLVLFALCCILALYLGLADITLPNDKWIHFTMFFLMSGFFYWIVDTKLTVLLRGITFVVCTIIGGVGSEYVQHLISPFRTFDPYDILANVCGSALAILVSDLYRWYKSWNERSTEDDHGEDNGTLLDDIEPV